MYKKLGMAALAGAALYGASGHRGKLQRQEDAELWATHLKNAGIVPVKATSFKAKRALWSAITRETGARPGDPAFVAIIGELEYRGLYPSDPYWQAGVRNTPLNHSNG